MKRLIKIMIALFAIGILGACTTVTAPDNQPVRQMNVSGTGQVSLTPDIAHVNIGVRNQSEDISEALDANNQATNQIVETLKEFGVEPQDIQTTLFNVYPQEPPRPFEGGEQEPPQRVYVVENRVNVTVRDLSDFGELLDSVIRAGANQIFGIQYDAEDIQEAQSQARAMAIENAQEKAQELAELTGVELGDVITVNVSSSGQPGPVFEGKGFARAEAAAEVPVSAGQLSVTMTANIVYEIR